MLVRVWKVEKFKIFYEKKRIHRNSETSTFTHCPVLYDYGPWYLQQSLFFSVRAVSKILKFIKLITGSTSARSRYLHLFAAFFPENESLPNYLGLIRLQLSCRGKKFNLAADPKERRTNPAAATLNPWLGLSGCRHRLPISDFPRWNYTCK